MNINVEVSGLKIGIDNTITDAIKTGNWGTRITFLNNDYTGRFEVCLTEEETSSLILKLNQSLQAIDDTRTSVITSY